MDLLGPLIYLLSECFTDIVLIRLLLAMAFTLDAILDILHTHHRDFGKQADYDSWGSWLTEKHGEAKSLRGEGGYGGPLSIHRYRQYECAIT